METRPQWAYNADDRVTTATDPNGTTVTYVYDADGEVTDTTDQDGRRTTYSYDADGDNTGETWLTTSGGKLDVITYTYDADQRADRRVRQLRDADLYLRLGRQPDHGGDLGPGHPPAQRDADVPATIRRHNRITLSDNLSSAGVTTFTYDADERVTGSHGDLRRHAPGPQVAISYDSGGRITSESRTIGGSGTAVNTNFSYDAANRQTTITDQLIRRVGAAARRPRLRPTSTPTTRPTG